MSRSRSSMLELAPPLYSSNMTTRCPLYPSNHCKFVSAWMNASGNKSKHVDVLPVPVRPVTDHTLSPGRCLGC